MSWVEGETLRDWVDSHPKPADRVRGFRYLEQVARLQLDVSYDDCLGEWAYAVWGNARLYQ